MLKCANDRPIHPSTNEFLAFFCMFDLKSDHKANDTVWQYDLAASRSRLMPSHSDILVEQSARARPIEVL